MSKWKVMIIFIGLAWGLSACSLPGIPQINQVIPTIEVIVATPTVAVEPSSTPTQAAVEPAGPPQPEVISADTAQRLQGRVVDLSLVRDPEYPRYLVWPSNREVDALSDQTMMMIQVDDLMYDAPTPLSLNGTLYDVAPDGSSLAVGNPGAAAGIYNLNGSLRLSLDEPTAYGAAFSPDGKFIAVPSSSEWAVSIYNTGNGQRLARLTGFETAAPVYHVVLSPEAKTLAWIARATLALQSVSSGEMVASMGFEDHIFATAFSADSTRLALYAGQAVYLKDAATGAELAKITVSEPVRSLAFSPDGKILAAAYGGAIQLWDGNTLAPLASLAGQGGPFTVVSFSPDGRTLASLSEVWRLVIWQVR